MPNKIFNEQIKPNTSKEDSTAKEPNYFSSLSYKYKKASHIIYIILAVSFVFTLLFNSSLLTYKNLNYLFRDLNAAAEVAADNYNSISYTNDEMRIVKSFRGGIITASSVDMTIYTATGRKTLHLNENFISPEIATSKKYAIVYELGGNKYSVYNSFSKVGGEKLDYPISYVSVADNGWFAVVSKDAEHASVVYLYDDDLQLRNTYYFASSRVFLVDINDNASRVAIFKTVSDMDKYSTELMLCEPDKEKSIFDVKISSGMIYGGGFLENGNIQAVCTDGYYLIDQSNGKISKSYNFDGRMSNRICVTDEGCVVSLSDNSGIVKNTILVFNKKGELVYNKAVDNGILDMEYNDGYIFINQADIILKIDTKRDNIESTKTVEKGNDIIVYDGNNILLCCQTKAKYIEI